MKEETLFPDVQSKNCNFFKKWGVKILTWFDSLRIELLVNWDSFKRNFIVSRLSVLLNLSVLCRPRLLNNNLLFFKWQPFQPLNACFRNRNLLFVYIKERLILGFSRGSSVTCEGYNPSPILDSSIQYVVLCLSIYEPLSLFHRLGQAVTFFLWQSFLTLAY